MLMRILHVNSYFKTNSVHQEFVRALASCGVQQRVFLPIQKAGDVARSKETAIGQVRVHEIPAYSGWARYIWPVKIFQIYQAALSVINIERPDLIHAHTLITNGLVAYFLSRRYGVPYVVTVRNTDVDVFFRKIPFFSYLGLKVMKRARKIMVLSPVYRMQKLPRYFPVKSYAHLYEKMEVVPSGINDGWFQPPILPRSKKNESLIFVGRVDKNKNLELVIDALKCLAENGVLLRLNVVGDGDQLDYLSKKAEGLDVVFYGRLESRDELKAIFQQSDVLVVPSRRETFGLVYAEALSQGLPIIYTAGQGFDNFFPDGQVGYRVSGVDPEELARAVLKIYEDYEAIANRAVDAAKQFRWCVAAKKITALYKSSVVAC